MRSQTYRFHEAANRIYDFFWGEFCDWYLELIKPRLNFEEGGDKTTRAQLLAQIWSTCLKALCGCCIRSCRLSRKKSGRRCTMANLR